MSRLVVVTDGSAAATALVRWLGSRVHLDEVISAVGERDVAEVVKRRQDIGRNEKFAVLAPTTTPPGQLGPEARMVVGKWLESLPPIDARARGAEQIEALRAQGEAGAEALNGLLAALSPVPISLPRPRRGRPRGHDPFSGAGFDVTTAMLLEPNRRWAERELAETTQRTPSMVHNVLKELARRGYVGRARGATLLREPLVLRDDLLAAWRAKQGSPRPVQAFLAPQGKDARKTAFSLAKRAGAIAMLAGNSAVDTADALSGGPVTIYLSEEPAKVFGGLFEATHRSGDVEVWTALERGVSCSPSTAFGFPATNRVITWLDLRLMGTDRTDEVAAAVWGAP